MNCPSLRDVLRIGRVLTMDGAMGTELARAGWDPNSGERTDTWNVTRPDQVAHIHQSYAHAGAEVHLSNTFMSWDSIPQAVALVRKTVPDGWLLADVGPPVDLDQIEQHLAAIGPDVDGLMIETISAFDVLPTVGQFTQRLRDLGTSLPVFLSVAYHHPEGREISAFDGTPPERFAEKAMAIGAKAIGVNCGRGISIGDCADILARYRSACDLPTFARPNADADYSPEEWSDQVSALLEAGACMVGGCCGTTPEHISRTREIVDRWNRAPRVRFR